MTPLAKKLAWDAAVWAWLSGVAALGWVLDVPNAGTWLAPCLLTTIVFCAASAVAEWKGTRR